MKKVFTFVGCKLLINTALLLVLFNNPILFAQIEMLPSNARPGETYTKCIVPQQYETVVEQVLLKEATSRIVAIPAQYETVTEQVMIKEGYTMYELVPPTFKWISDSILIQEAATELLVTPAQYKTVQKNVLVTPATTEWEKKETSDCPYPKNCVTWHLKEIPPVYKTINNKVLVSPGKVEEKTIPAKYQVIKKCIVDIPSEDKVEDAETLKKVVVPPFYKTIEKRVLVSPATTREVAIPAEYSTITTQKLVSTGGFTEWVQTGGPKQQASASASARPSSSLSSTSRPNPSPSKSSSSNTNLYAAEGYAKTKEFDIIATADENISTFSIDVDKAAYANVRRMIKQHIDLGSDTLRIPKGAVRIEEMLNYFTYDYPRPNIKDKEPFTIHTEMANCPWNREKHLVQIALQAAEIPKADLPPQNLVFLIDVSGSMSSANKLPLVKKSLQLLVDELRPEDKIAIVVYAGSARVALPATSGKEKQHILEVIHNLSAGGGTAGGQAISMAYDIAEKNFAKKGNNRIILATDGDFNVGVSSNEALKELVSTKKELGIYLSVLGFGMGNYQDEKMETISNYGNGNYAYIDNIKEAKKTLVTEMGGTLHTLANDTKIQVVFNPEKVKSYRLIGYENRRLTTEDFEDDKKDAGELGLGHAVTALYEVSLHKNKNTSKKNKDRKAQNEKLLTIKCRYKRPQKDKSLLVTKHVNSEQINKHSRNLNFAAAVVGFGMLLRDSPHKGKLTYTKVQTLAKASIGSDENGYRKDFVDLLESVKGLKIVAVE